MSEELRYSERDVVLRERTAFVAGGLFAIETPNRRLGELRPKANACYPLPSVVVVDSESVIWRLNAGGIEYRWQSHPQWYALPSALPRQASYDIPALTVERLDLLQRLRSEASE